MAKKKKVVTTAKTQKKNLQPTRSRTSSGVKSSKSVSREMLFGKTNYMWMFAGVGLIALGLILMSGGKMPDENTWDPDLIYSFRRITLAPVIILAGLACQVVAIFKRK